MRPLFGPCATTNPSAGTFSRARNCSRCAKRAWRAKSALPPGYPDPDRRQKRIGQEHRHYIVDGEIIASSRYKLSGTPNFSEGSEPIALEAAREAISRWTPARAFVLDTYILGDEAGIVEIGCIGHAGLYAADTTALAWALDSMPPADPRASAGKRLKP